MILCVVVIHLSFLKVINHVKRGNSYLTNRRIRLRFPLDNSYHCLIVCTSGLDRAFFGSIGGRKIVKKETSQLSGAYTINPRWSQFCCS